MVESEGDESKDGPPDTDNLRCEIAPLKAKEASKTHKPVAANTTEEDRVEVRSDLLLRSEADDG